MNTKLIDNRYAVKLDLPNDAVIGEVGVGYGDFTAHLLGYWPKVFHAIDLFEIDQHSTLMGQSHFITSGKNQYDYYMSRFEKEISNSRIIINKGCSWEILKTFNNDYFDLLYIDAAHDYESVKKDIEASLRKIKSGGFLWFDDCYAYNKYENKEYGVWQAVQELLKGKGIKPLYYSMDGNIVVQVNKEGY